MRDRPTIASWERWVLAGVLVLYLSAGVIYSVVTPIFEAPDESYHFFVVQHIVEHRALPVQRADARGPWEQEGSQPPLYYLIGALLIGGTDMEDAEQLLWSNPQANIGDPLNPGNKNVYIHPPEQDFPWRGATLAVHILRFYSLAMGAATIGAVWGTIKLLFPRQSALPLLVGGTVAFIPQFLFITSSVNNDNLMTFLSTLCVYLLLRLLRDRSNRLVDWLAVGLVVGLALLTKLSALALLGLAGTVIVLLAWYRRSWGLVLRLGLVVGVIVLAVAGWWYVRNVVLYGEPTGLTAMWEVVGRRESFGTELWSEFRGLRYSFWGLFGWFSIVMPDWIYCLLDALTLVAAVGVLLSVGRWMYLGLWRRAWGSFRHREPEWGAAFRPLAYLLLVVLASSLFVALVRWTSLTAGSQGRLLFPALVSIALFWVLGLRAWFPRQYRNVASLAFTLALVTLAFAVPWCWVAPYYARPAEAPQLPQAAIPLDVSFGESIKLYGVRFPQSLAYPGQAFRVDLYWQADRVPPAQEEVLVWLRLIEEQPAKDDPSRGMVGLEDAYPGSGALPISLWPQDTLLAGFQYIRVGEDAPAPLVARLDVGLYEESTGKLLSDPEVDLPTIGRVKIVPRRWPKVDHSALLARFGHGVALADCDLDYDVQPGSNLRVALTWTVEEAPRRDYQVFVHLVDGQGRAWAMGDGAPRRGIYPTFWWEVGEVIVDEHLLPLGQDVPTGQYQVLVGWYDGSGRVPAFGLDGALLAGEAVSLGPVEVH
jgi:4-amino-4-deoxy-L-arabinose transferase-like glycosyltransferase